MFKPEETCFLLDKFQMLSLDICATKLAKHFDLVLTSLNDPILDKIKFHYHCTSQLQFSFKNILFRVLEFLSSFKKKEGCIVCVWGCVCM